MTFEQWLKKVMTQSYTGTEKLDAEHAWNASRLAMLDEIKKFVEDHCGVGTGFENSWFEMSLKDLSEKLNDMREEQMTDENPKQRIG